MEKKGWRFRMRVRLRYFREYVREDVRDYFAPLTWIWRRLWRR